MVDRKGERISHMYIARLSPGLIHGEYTLDLHEVLAVDKPWAKAG